MESIAPTPTPKAKGFKITPLRLFRYKETLGCPACETRDPKRGHTRECRERFAEIIAKETQENVRPDKQAQTEQPECPDPLRPVPEFPVESEDSGNSSGSGGPGKDTSYIDGEQPVPETPRLGVIADEGMLGVMMGQDDLYDGDELVPEDMLGDADGNDVLDLP